MEDTKKKLFRSAMRGGWDEVMKIYEANEEAHTAKITKSGDTALHVAVADDQPDIVEHLLSFIKSKDKVKEVLEIKNERGDTSLHLAASMGSVKMCECIADAYPDLIGARNHDSETPLFLAALHGMKEVFLCLDSIGGTEKGNTYCRRNDGDTILHCAISGEYYDLAFQIIRRYSNLVNSVNEQGLSPLHLLATKRSSFRSGSHFGLFTNIIYHCILVEKLEVETFTKKEDLVKTFDEEKNPPYPENYQTCINFLRLSSLALKILFCPTVEQANKKTTKAKTGKDPSRSGGQADPEDPSANQKVMKGQQSQGHRLFPSNYDTCFDIIKFVSKAMLIILGYGFKDIKKIREKKEKHVWAAQILDELLSHEKLYEYEDSLQKKDAEITPYHISDDPSVFFYNTEENQHLPGGTAAPTSPATNQQGEDKGAQSDRSSREAKQKQKGNDKNKTGEQDKNKPSEMKKNETPILVAAKNGVVEIVERILELFPVAIHDKDYRKKNVVLLAVECRQPHVYEMLLKRKVLKDTVFRQVDIEGNSALHLVAKLGYFGPYPFPAVQMQWEIKWYQYVKHSIHRQYFIRYNKEGKTAKEIFTESHQVLASKGGKWLNYISNSCSVVATLITAVSFATTATTPGGIKENSSKPTFERHPGYLVYAVSSLIGLAFSVTSVVTFLSILTARRKIKDFDTRLPRKLLLGLTCLFISIGAMLVCFCAAHFFLLKDVLEHNAFPIYALACLPVTIFAIAQFPLYFVLLRMITIQRVPQRIIT